MGGISKSLASVLILIVAISSLTVLIVKPTNAQSTTKPSVPDFTIEFVRIDSQPLPEPLISYSEPLVNVTIKNQLFTPFTDQNGHKINLYYLIDWKQPSDNVWQQGEIPLQASNSSYTVYSFYLVYSGQAPPKGQVDFQVESVIGYITYIQGSVPKGEYIPPTYTGEVSGWSNTQTITISSTSNTPSPTPTVPEFPILAIIPIMIGVLSIAVIIKKWSRKFD
jgi:hypothetical protein